MISNPEFVELALSLSEHLCVSSVVESDSKTVLLVAPYATGGRFANASDEIRTDRDIRVMHEPMSLWPEGARWIVKYTHGQTWQTKTFADSTSALEFVRGRIESYWRNEDKNRQ